MSKVHIELDLEIVQKVIHARIQPAVDEILDGVDVPALIKKALLKKPEGGRDYYTTAMYMMGYGGRASGPAVEQLIDSAIYSAAKIYVENAVERERLNLEAAFEKMLRNSSSKLAKTMVASLQSGLKNDWSFTIDTQIGVKEPEREYSDN